LQIIEELIVRSQHSRHGFSRHQSQAAIKESHGGFRLAKPRKGMREFFDAAPISVCHYFWWIQFCENWR
jgi:hypothetical protein